MLEMFLTFFYDAWRLILKRRLAPLIMLEAMTFVGGDRLKIIKEIDMYSGGRVITCMGG